MIPQWRYGSLSGLLIGFSWECAFDDAVETITEATGWEHDNKWKAKVFQMTLAVGLSLIVIPAYWQYILPIVNKKEEEKEEEDKKFSQQSGRGKEPL
eukprot:gene57863-biopygen17505